MAQSQYAYNFSLFDSYDYGTSAPAYEPTYEPEVKPVKKKTAKKQATPKVTEKQRAASKNSHIASAKILLCIFSIAAVFSIVLFLNVQLDETAMAINSVQHEIDIAKSEKVRLEAELEGMVSIDKVEDYAENNLGMVKLEDFKITYFDSGEDNHVVISGGKSYNENSILSKFDKIKEYFS